MIRLERFLYFYIFIVLILDTFQSVIVSKFKVHSVIHNLGEIKWNICQHDYCLKFHFK